MPRETELNEEKIRQVKEMSEMMLPMKSIADILGVSPRTLRRWKRRGEQDIESDDVCSIHARFVLSLRAGYAKTEVRIFEGLLACLAQGKHGAGVFILTHHPHYKSRWQPEGMKLEDAMKLLSKAIQDGNQDVIRQLRDIATLAAQEPPSAKNDT